MWKIDRFLYLEKNIFLVTIYKFTVVTIYRTFWAALEDFTAATLDNSHSTEQPLQVCFTFYTPGNVQIPCVVYIPQSRYSPKWNLMSSFFIFAHLDDWTPSVILRYVKSKAYLMFGQLGKWSSVHDHCHGVKNSFDRWKYSDNTD